MSDVRQAGGGWYRILTAPGPGAVAVIELNCDLSDRAEFVLRRIVSVAQHPFGITIGRICYGRWNDEDLIVVRSSERTWEIQCHGGTIALNRICRDLLSDDVQERNPTDKSELTEVDVQGAGTGSPENIQQLVQSAIDDRLVNARSRKTAGLILVQASNSLCSDLQVILDAQNEDTSEARAIRKRLADWKDIADHLTTPWRVVLAGAPNVGKSSLMNAIAGMERSIVCDQPGTTRDVVEVDAMIEGWSFRFVDTAGIRRSGIDEIEERGIVQSQLEASQCDVLCLIFDGDSDIPEWSNRLSLATLPKHTVLVRNKSDLAAAHESFQPPFPNASALAALPMIKVSALTGDGLPILLQWIKQSVVPLEPTKDTALPLCCL